MKKENRRYTCNCCGHDFSKEEGLEYSKKIGAASTYMNNNKAIIRRIIVCPMCSAPKKYCDAYLV